MVERIRVNHDERQTVAGNFVVDFYAVRIAVRHEIVSEFKSFNRFAPFKPFK
jgi:hypothetical protein